MGHLQISQLVQAPRFEVFDYLTNPANLPELLAPKIDVQVLNAEAPLKRGSEFHYSMTRYGLSQSIRLRVEDVLRGSRLTYRQVEGLFHGWTHTIKISEQSSDSTLITDIVDYTIPFGLVGLVADDLLIKRDMSQLLTARLHKAAAHFQPREATG
jgi:ligand-binding SRPBCC domain-containing protein